MADNTKDISENPRNMPENSKNIIDELKEIYEGISVALKLIFSIALIFSIVMGFTFAVTYMRNKEFFSYEIFSLSNIWIFLLAGIYMVMILLVAYGLLIYAIFIRKPKDSQQKESQHDSNSNIERLKNKFSNLFSTIKNLDKEWLKNKFSNLFSTIFNFFNNERNYVYLSIVPAFIICIKIGINLLLAVYIFFFILFLILYFVLEEIKDKIKLMIFIIIFALLMYFITLLPFSDFHTKFYKEFLKSINLASDHAEIYLKDKNKSVPGKLIFDDGKYAYVEFDRTYSNCIGVGDSCIKTIRKKVPSEDVSIITKVKKDTKASVPK